MSNATADCHFERQKIGAQRIKNICERQVSPLYGFINGNAVPHIQSRINQSGMIAVSNQNLLLAIGYKKKIDGRTLLNSSHQ